MKSFLILYLICFYSPLRANEKSLLKEIQVNPTYSTQLLNLVINHLADFPRKQMSEREIINTLNQINQNLKGQSSNSVNALIHTEFFKAIYDFKNNPTSEIKKGHVSNSNLIALQEKLNQYQALYSSFSLFLIRDAHANYKVFQANNFLNSYLNKTKKLEGREKEIRRIKQLNQFIGPWVILFLKFNSKQFNELCSDSIIRFFKSLEKISHYFKFNNPGLSDTELFIHKSGTISEYISKLQQNESTNKKSATERPNSPEEDVKNINVDPAEAAGEKIDEIIEKIDKNQL